MAGTAWTFKKSAHALEQEPPEILARRHAWFDGQLDLDSAKLVFVDKIGLFIRMACPLKGAPRGGVVLPEFHTVIGMTTTLTPAPRLSGMTAPFVNDKARRFWLVSRFSFWVCDDSLWLEGEPQWANCYLWRCVSVLQYLTMKVIVIESCPTFRVSPRFVNEQIKLRRETGSLGRTAKTMLPAKSGGLSR